MEKLQFPRMITIFPKIPRKSQEFKDWKKIRSIPRSSKIPGSLVILNMNLSIFHSHKWQEVPFHSERSSSKLHEAHPYVEFSQVNFILGIWLMPFFRKQLGISPKGNNHSSTMNEMRHEKMPSSKFKARKKLMKLISI